MTNQRDTRRAPHGGGFLRLIAVFKFLEALTLVGTGLAALQLLRPEIVGLLQDWVQAMPISTEQRLAQHLLGWLTGLAPGRIRALGAGAFLFATIFLVEGIGLWLRRRWAEWLTVVATALLIPMELLELRFHPGAAKMLALIVNVAVVAYLVYQIRAGEPGSPRGH